MRRTIFWLLVGLVLAALVTGQHAQAQGCAPVSSGRVSASHLATNPQLVPASMAKKVIHAAETPAAGAFTNPAMLVSGSLQELVRRLIVTGLVVVVAILLLVGIRRVRRHANVLLERQRERIPAFRFRGLELVSAQALFTNIGRIATGLYLLFFALVVLGAALMVLFLVVL